ncbi:hypothetical protein [Roseivirga seohaensis]|uniref:hypothetical protein n=1 Tax=Roseivirga seohaensis TaxID=1914963 RepID=UPI003BAA22EA
MKKRMTTILPALALIMATSLPLLHNNQEKDLARVERVQGKYVFVMSQPTMDYDVVDDLSTGGTSALLGKQSIDDQIANMVKRGLKRVEKGDIKDFDAIVTPDGQRGTLIKFK